MFLAVAVDAQTTAFTYQGRFTDTTAPLPTNGNYTMTFRLFDAEAGGTQIGTDITSMVAVVNGVFTFKLNFGAAAFNTTGARYLEIRVGASVLTPRQEITSTPFANRAVNAAAADTLSGACVGCVTNAQINSIDGAKITGTISNATVSNATTAQNVSGVVSIANGGTGSSTKNFVDTTTNQTVGGSKTFTNAVSANSLTAGSGGLNMNGSIVRLRDSADSNHGMLYNSTIDGTEFRGFTAFRWTTGVTGATERMSLNGSGNLTVNGNITANGTLNGTLANNSVGAAQVADGSLRITDFAVNSQSIGGAGGTFGPHGCLSLTVTAGTIPNLAANDVVYFIPPASTPAGFSFQPVYVTGAGTFFYNVCNTLNANNTLPAQLYRVFVLRP